jgi:predicted nucleic acid-binding protein
MTSSIKRIYVETSVSSGMFDSNDHPVKAQPFWDAVKRGEIRIIVSDVLTGELEAAPRHVRDYLEEIPKSQVERIVSTDESDRLAALYIAARIIRPTHLTDCKHVVLAAIARADALVSWNCRHIVNHNRIDFYNDINVVLGYPRIAILTPDGVPQKGGKYDDRT